MKKQSYHVSTKNLRSVPSLQYLRAPAKTILVIKIHLDLAMPYVVRGPPHGSAIQYPTRAYRSCKPRDTIMGCLSFAQKALVQGLKAGRMPRLPRSLAKSLDGLRGLSQHVVGEHIICSHSATLGKILLFTRRSRVRCLNY